MSGTSADTAPKDALYLQSAIRESILEHRFLADIGAALWNRGICDFAVSHAEVDSQGYDVVIEVGQTLRRIQLKSTIAKGSTRAVPVQRRLFANQDGCVVLMRHPRSDLGRVSYAYLDPALLALSGFDPPLAKKTVPNSKGEKVVKKNHWSLPLALFVSCEVDALIDRLFGLTLPAA